MTDEEHKPLHPSLQFLYLLLLWFGFFILAGLSCFVIIVVFFGKGTWNDIANMTNTGSPQFIAAFRVLMSLGNSLLVFLAPAVVFSYFVVREPVEYIGLQNRLPAILLLLAAIIMFLFLPTIDITSYFNQKMTLPAPMHGLDKWIHDTETSQQNQIKVLLDMKTPADLMITLVLVAALPALSEEFFFRGVCSLL